MKYFLPILILFFGIQSTKLFSQVYLDPKVSVDDRVNDLLGRMTLDEKIGQMIQTERNVNDVTTKIKTLYLGSILSGGGSVPGSNTVKDWVDMYNGFQNSALSTRLKIPIIYGIDAVHGHNNVYGATIFPHNIGMGCTRDSQLVRLCAAATAMEVRATGLNWTFSPCIAVPRDIRWGRTYEGFGETPELQKMMAFAAVKGYQGETLGTPNRIVACAKHFVADGGTEGGQNEGDAVITEDELRSIHLPGYIQAIDAGVGSVMVSFSSWNGEKCHGNYYLLTTVLKEELGFKGFVVSDWAGINQLSNNTDDAIDKGINAGIDMIMEPYDPDQVFTILKNLVNGGSLSQDRVDDAVKRILTVKFQLGLFENPNASIAFADSLGNSYHRSLARRAVRESQVLLKNNNLLPLSKATGKILVAGGKANDIGSQCGGWTITWQGASGTTTKGTTILAAIQAVRGADNVSYSETGSFTGEANVAVVVVGEKPYAEGNGDNAFLSLDADDLNVIANVKKLNIPYVVILVSGRPMMVQSVINDADAFVAAWLPGTEGMGVTDVLFGDYPFTGKLSHTWPASVSQIPINFGDSPYNPSYAYGDGLKGDGTDAIHQIKTDAVVFPNPADEMISVSIQSQISVAEIYNIQGILISSVKINSAEKFSVYIGNLKSGDYCLVLKDKKGTSHSVVFQKK